MISGTLLLLSAGAFGMAAALLLVPRGQARVGSAAGPGLGPGLGPGRGQGSGRRPTPVTGRSVPLARGVRQGPRGGGLLGPLRLLGLGRGGVDVTRDAALLLRQLSALLQSGRGPGQVWEDLARQWALWHSDASAAGAGPRPDGPAPRQSMHPLAQLCARAAAADRAGRGAAEGLDRVVAELRRRLDEAGRLGPFAELRAGLLPARRPRRRDPRVGPELTAGSRREDVRLLRVARRLAGLLRLSEETGAPLSRLAEELAATLDDDGEVAAAISSAVAGPRLTQLVLAALPVGGLLIGQLIGADALGVLLGSPVGLACLGAGGGLVLAGMWWSRGMIRAVENHG